ncbi:MAG: type II and III secretion system protein family protein [Armatimonadota bacterium]
MKDRVCMGIVFIMLLLCPIGAASGGVIDREQADMVLQVGDSRMIECSGVTRVAVGDPNVADISVISSKEVLLNAKSPGKTKLHIWDAGGYRLYGIEVQPAMPDIEGLTARITAELNDPRILVRGVGDTLILEGVVASEAESSRAESIARAVTESAVFNGVETGGGSQEVKTVSRPEGDSFVLERSVQNKRTEVKAETGLRCPKVVNLLRIEKPMGQISVRTLETADAIRSVIGDTGVRVTALPGSVVMIEGRVGTVEELAHIDQVIKGWAKKTEDDKGGIDWSDQLTEIISVVNAVTVDSSLARQVLVRAQVLDINRDDLKELGVEWGNVFFDDEGNPNVTDQPFLIGERTPGNELFDINRIVRLTPLGARVRALVTNNRAKILSEPVLLVMDGREASMLVGGEVPIPIVQSADLNVATSVTVVFKEFGVRLRILPNITGADRLQLRVMPEVSALDFGNAVVFSGFVIPAFSTRRAETTVNIRDGQSLIIGGLVDQQLSKVVRKIPLLGDIPIIGEFFKSTRKSVEQRDLVIMITPQIIQPSGEPPVIPNIPTIPEELRPESPPTMPGSVLGGQ